MSIFLLGVYDPSSSKWCTVTKCHSGLDDKTLEELQTSLDMVKISKNADKVRVKSLAYTCTMYFVPSRLLGATHFFSMKKIIRRCLCRLSSTALLVMLNNLYILFFFF